MKLVVLGSSSSGNCYLLIAKDEILILEAGLTAKEIIRQINHDTSKVVGCLVSHKHGDHYKGAEELSARFIKIYSNESVIEKIGDGVVLQEKANNKIGNFMVYPLSVQHDVPTSAFVITHPEMGQLVFCTDAASFPYNIKGTNHLLVEANYDESLVEKFLLRHTDAYNNIKRLERSHMSLQQACEVIDRHNEHCLNTIMLLHLSDRNSDDDMFKTEVQKVCGKPVQIARKGLVIDLTINV